MTRVIIDAETQKKLGDLTEPVEVCDATGRVIAYMTPAGLAAGYGGARSPHTDDELKRRESEPARPLAKVLADLEA